MFCLIWINRKSLCDTRFGNHKGLFIQLNRKSLWFAFFLAKYKFASCIDIFLEGWISWRENQWNYCKCPLARILSVATRTQNIWKARWKSNLFYSIFDYPIFFISIENWFWAIIFPNSIWEYNQQGMSLTQANFR